MVLSADKATRRPESTCSARRAAVGEYVVLQSVRVLLFSKMPSSCTMLPSLMRLWQSAPRRALRKVPFLCAWLHKGTVVLQVAKMQPAQMHRRVGEHARMPQGSHTTEMWILRVPQWCTQTHDVDILTGVGPQRRLLRNVFPGLEPIHYKFHDGHASS